MGIDAITVNYGFMYTVHSLLSEWIGTITLDM